MSEAAKKLDSHKEIVDSKSELKKRGIEASDFSIGLIDPAKALEERTDNIRNILIEALAAQKARKNKEQKKENEEVKPKKP